MSIWIRKITGNKSENFLKLGKDVWDLRDLYILFESWVTKEGPNLNSREGWIADIGFSPRAGASGGGPILTPEVMKICVEKNISIYLSEYDDREENV